MVSLVGTGGVGKTRLARRFAWSALERFPGGAWFCDLSEASGPEGIFFAVARALDVPLSPRLDPAEQLGHAIAGRGRCLVILDNFEHLARHAEATLGRWRQRAEEASFLVTSRAPLALTGERRLALEPLPLPPPDALPDSVLESAAAALFVARARRAAPGFALTEDNARDISRLVEQLDGLPLAIELAAARARLLSPGKMLERMRQRFRLLARAGRSGRHATLRATIEWSWSLLNPPEREALARCSAFEGGFTLEAARAVLQAEADPEHLVRSLTEKCLLRAWQPSARSGAPRFGMYRSLRSFAEEQLQERASRPACLRRHAVFYAGFGAPGALQALYRAGGIERGQAMAAELDNLVAACRRAIRWRDAPLATATARAAAEALDQQGPARAGIALLSEALEGTDPGDEDRLNLLIDLGGVSQQLGREAQVERCLREALALAEALGARRRRGRTLSLLGMLYAKQGEVERARGRSTRRRWRCSAARIPAGRAARWAAWGTCIGRGASPTRPSPATRRRWPSTRRSATAAPRATR